jgi:hypothetical protein
MTTEEIQAEWHYRYQERLGIMCEDQEPTLEQKAIAYREANEWAMAQEADKK